VFSNSGRFLLAGIGQEHRLGRWNCIKSAKNGIKFIPLPSSSPSDEDSEFVNGISSPVQQNEETL